MKIVIVTILSLSLVLMGAAVFAGDFHTGSGLKCYQCHIMHQTKSHAYGDDSHDSATNTSGQAYGAHLLKYADANTTCLSCHNAGDSKDVYKGFNTAPGATPTTPFNRISGWFGLSTDTNQDFTGVLANDYGHDLNNGAQTPPGGTSAVSLGCPSCHDPHGNASYRNLGTQDADGNRVDSGITYEKGTYTGTVEVFQATPPTGVNKFDVSNISYEPVSGSSHYEQYCVSCHTSIHNSAATSNGWMKHPTMGVSRAYTAGTVSPLKTIGGLPQAGQSGALVAGQVSCMTCHKAHGSDHPFGLIYDNRTTTALEDGTGTGSGQIRTTCKHCHDKGLVAPDATGANGE